VIVLVIFTQRDSEASICHAIERGRARLLVAVVWLPMLPLAILTVHQCGRAVTALVRLELPNENWTGKPYAVGARYSATIAVRTPQQGDCTRDIQGTRHSEVARPIDSS